MIAACRRHLFLLLRILCAAGLMLWVLHKVRLGGGGERFSWAEVDWRWLVLAVAFGGFCVVGWACRWRFFLRVYDLHIGFREGLRLTLFAEFFNLYFLGPLGADGMRLLALSRRFPKRKRAILGSLFMDHTGGLLGGALFYWLFTHSADLITAAEMRVADIAIGALLGATFMGLNVIMAPGLQRFIQGIPILRWSVKPLMPFYTTERRYPWLLGGYGMSILSTGCAYAAYWAAAKGMGCGVSLPKMLGVMPVGDILASLPISVSGLGIRENVVIELLGRQEGIGASKALAISLLGFAGLGLWGAVGGVWLMLARRQGGRAETAELPVDAQPNELNTTA